MIVPEAVGETDQIPLDAPPDWVKVVAVSKQIADAPETVMVGQPQLTVAVAELLHPEGDSVTITVYGPFARLVWLPSASAVLLMV